MDVQFIPCRTFGGGWLLPKSEAGEQACLSLFEEPAAFCEPIGEDAYIIEPADVGEIVMALREDGCEVTL